MRAGRTRVGRGLAACALAAALGLGACTVEPVHQRAYPRLEEGVPAIERVAVVPLGTGADLAEAARRAEREAGVSVGEAPRPQGVTPEQATALVGRFLAEALAKRGLDVTPPDDMARAIAEAGLDGRRQPRELARLASDHFGAQGIVMGTVSRYRERTGGAQESGAASVWFEVALYTAPEGEKLWTGVFNETQRPASYNVLVTSRYPGGGSRWLTVDELARWGADETAASMPVGSTAPPAPRR